MKDTHGSGEDFIDLVCRTEIGDKLGYKLINNLNDLNLSFLQITHPYSYLLLKMKDLIHYLITYKII